MIQTLLSTVLAMLLLANVAFAQQPAADEVNQQAAKLEADLGKYKDSSPEAAEVMVKLAKVYHDSGRVFGLARVAQQFVSAHPSDPRHKDMMLKLLDGLDALSRNKDFAATCRQFLTRYPQAKECADIEVRLADVLGQMDDRAKTAEACASVWTRQPGTPIGRQYGIRAITIFSQLGTPPMVTKGAQLGDEMIDKLPAGDFVRHLGWQTFNDWRRISQWAKSNTTGAKLLQKNTAGDALRQRDYHSMMADNYGNLGQHANAVESLKKARALGDMQGIHYQLIVRMAVAGAKAAELEPIVNDYTKKYPERDDRYVGVSYLAQALIRDGDKERGLKFLAALLPLDAQTNNNAQFFVQQNGNEPEKLKATEEELKKALATNTKQAAFLRYVLAIDLYRDRMKDNAKAKAVIRESLAKSPSNDGYTTGPIDWLLYNAANDNEFKADVALVIKTRRENIHMGGLRDTLLAWQRSAKQNKDLKDRAVFVANELQKANDDPVVKIWLEQLPAQPPQAAALREQLRTAKTLASMNDRLARDLLYAQHYHYRYIGPAKDRPLCIAAIAQFCQRFPTEYGPAVTYLDYTTDAGTPENQKDALVNLLKLEPAVNNSDTWRRMMSAADQAKDPKLVQQAFAWIQKAQSKFGKESGSATYIGDTLLKYNFENEALAYWKFAVEHDRNNYEASESASRLLTRMKDPAERRKLLTDLLKPESEYHGRYETWLAADYFLAGDFDNFEKVLAEGRKRQNERPFRNWGIDWSVAATWMDNARNNKDMPVPAKVKILTAIRNLEVMPSSAAAGLALLELPPSEKLAPTARLLAYAAATRLVGNDANDWDRLMPFAQGAVDRKDYVTSATLATGMLANVTNADENRKKTARDIVTQSYARMGSVGLTIDENSPLAPLFQAALYLRLGDERLAFDAYAANKKLFDEHKANLPVDLITFVCDRLIAASGDQNHDHVEEILRGWLVKNSESKQLDDATKAKVQLLLAKNFFKAQRYDVARSEYTTVVNRYPNTPQSVEAEFGIGETFMAQKVYDQAEQTFEKLSRHQEMDVVVRAEFLRGVLAFRRGDRDEAREIFRGVLERVPNVELANQALYSLAEVYGAEEKYIDQLNLLRTVGRLGRSSKRKHVPGMPLSIVVHDSDLGISRGHNRIPVLVTTEPGGDRETIYLTSAGAGKGLFRVDLETRLGQAAPNDNVLQLTGKDVIKCDYPPEFKSEFKTVPLSDVEIHMAADARFAAASSKIEEKVKATFSEELRQQLVDDENADQRKSQVRPDNQIKPGNVIYLQVKDADRDISNEPDQVVVKLTADSGDQVQVPLLETGPHTGIFEAVAKSGELPAGARASDTAIDHSPLMAIDHDPKTYWMSEPDGATPKMLTIDMKDLKSVSRVKISSPSAENNVPVRGELLGSQDGEFWFRVGSNPAIPVAEPVAGEYGAMRKRVYVGNFTNYTTWAQVVALTKNAQPIEDEVVPELSWQRPEDAEGKKNAAVVWHGKLVQPKDGAARIKVDGGRVALAIDGREEMPLGAGGRTVDVWLTAGTHDLTIFAATVTLVQPVAATWTRADLKSALITLAPFRKADFDLDQQAAKNAKPAADPKATNLAITDTAWEFHFPSVPLRYTRFVVQEYRGEAIAVNNVEVAGEKADELYIPTKSDVLALANNDVLEIAGGDVVTVSYTDEFTQQETSGSQLLAIRLTATYNNANVNPIAYDFTRAPNGVVQNLRKDLMRVDPGERVIVEIVDYDEDRTNQRDTVKFQVAVNDGPFIDLEAVETENYTGLFTKEVDTAPVEAPAVPADGKTATAANAAPAKSDKLRVKPGDRILIRYMDEQNTFPGHPVPRDAVVYVNHPTVAKISVMKSRVIPGKPGTKIPAKLVYTPADSAASANPEGQPAAENITGVAFEAPLTVELIDPDAAKDSRSTVTVTLTTTDGSKVDVDCVVSGAFTNTPQQLQASRALEEGRFIGQVIMQLGGKNSPDLVPVTAEMPRGLIGKVKTDEEAGSQLGTNLVTRVLNLSGNDIISATYNDARRPDGKAEDITSRARLISNGELACTDREYEKDVTQLHVGEKLFLKVVDADRDTSDARDSVEVEVTSELGEHEVVKLEETLAHSGIFTGSFLLKAVDKPMPDNLVANEPVIESYFGDILRIRYVDPSAASSETGKLELRKEIPVVVGTDGLVAAFTKTFNDETLAVETKFRVAESYFELFKSHKTLERTEEKNVDLEAGRRILREVMEDYPDPKYAPRIAYLLGQFSQELGQWDEAVRSYEIILRQYPDHVLAPDAQYKLAQSYEEAGNFDQALEAYVTLAATHPKSPLIPSVMIRISDHFYKAEKYGIAAQVGEKFLERFEGHQHGPKMAFRVGQCYYKSKLYKKAGESFDKFGKRFPEDALASDSLFWAGESYRLGTNNLEAFRRYNRCRWDYPSSEAAKYARGRLALPEMLQQFEADANSVDQ